MEVDVRNDWNVDLALNFAKGIGSFHVRDSAPDDLTTCGFKLVNLTHGSSDVTGVRFGHGLDGYGGVTTHLYASDPNGLGYSTLSHVSSTNLTCKAGLAEDISSAEQPLNVVRGDKEDGEHKHTKAREVHHTLLLGSNLPSATEQF